MPSQDAFLAGLEADLRALSNEARRSDSLAGQLTGWLSGPEHPAIKEAAERAMLKLRSTVDQGQGLEAIKGNKEILKPILMACEAKSPKLASIALLSIQKLVANDLVQPDDMPSLLLGIEQLEKLREETVQLKILQTTHTLMQSTVVANNEEGVKSVLGLCFRLLADPKNTDSVVSTAAATVRQAVALVFEHISLKPESRSPAGSPGESRSLGIRGESPSRRASMPPIAEAGPANAALKLLDQLCMMTTANEGMLRWINVPDLPRAFVLDLLDFVLGNNTAIFMTNAAFEHALLVRVCQLLITLLQNLLDPGCDIALQAADLRPVLRVVRTVLRHFHRQLRLKCGVFVECLLAGTSPTCTLWQRINVMQVFRQLVTDASILHFLFVSYDLREDCKLKAVTEMVRCFAEVVETTLRLSDNNDDESLKAVAALYHSKASGKDWTLDVDCANISQETGAAYLTMLAIDCLLGVVACTEKLTSLAVEGAPTAPGPGLPPTGANGHVPPVLPEAHRTGRVSPREELRREVSRAECEALVEATWKLTLAALSQLLARCASEALTIQLLRGYQLYTQACGMLELVEPRNAYLSSLCSFTLSNMEEAGEPPERTSSPSEPPSANGRMDIASRSSSATAMSRCSLLESPDGLVLTPKNVQALRTLFNVAHRLDSVLGPAWLLVMTTLTSLDRILKSPRTTTQEISQGSSGALPSDLAILTTAANQLFESTAHMSTEAATSLLTALREVSLRSLPTLAQVPGQPRLYALQRMVDVVLFNVGRIHDLWPIFLDHIVEVLAESKPPVRTAACEALGRAIGGALASLHSNSKSGRGGEAGGGSKDGGAAEHMLLVSLESLYRDVQQPDVRLSLLRVLLHILQRHGEQLGTGWRPALRILEAVPQDPEVDSEAVGLAFQSVQLLSSDYMAALPLDLLRTSLEVAAIFGSQQADLNVSLSSVSLLWNAADLFSKRTSSTGADFMTPEDIEELLRLDFMALQGLSTDSRPEVRNSGMRTLYAVVVSQGARLSAAAWDECLWEMLFPLLREVHHLAATSSRQEAAAEILGKVKGKSVAMLVHHSRNSQQKQWEETLVLALAGMSRLLRTHLPLIVNSSSFPQGWEELMLVVESSMAGGRKEVALAAIGLVTNVIMAHGGTPLVSHAMWKRALRALGVGVEAAASPNCMVPLQARLELVTAIGQVQAALKEVMEEEDCREMLTWLERLAKNPFSQEDSIPIVPGTLPPVQKAVLSLLPTLPPLSHPGQWTDLLSLLLRLLQPQRLPHKGNRGGTHGDHAEGTVHQATSSSTNVNRHALSSATMERVAHIVAHMYRDQAPWQARAAMFPAVLSSLAACLATRYTAFEEGLWRAAVPAFTTVVSAGLPAINIAYINGDEPPPDDCWSALADSFEVFLLGSLVEDDAPGAEVPGDPAGPLQHIDEPGGSRGPQVDPGMVTRDGGPHSRRTTSDSDGEAAGPGRAAARDAAGPAAPGDPGPTLPSGTGTPLENEQSRIDADLEASVLDALTDGVLTACARTPREVTRRLVAVVERGVARRRGLAIPNSAAGSRFGQLCLRKLFVLCSRGVDAPGPHACLLEVAQLAYPLFVEACRRMLEVHAEEVREGREVADRARLDDLLCMLDALATLTVAPPVAESVLAPGSPLQALAAKRQKLAGRRGARLQTHLLVLYEPLCACLASQETRVRSLLQDIFFLAGAQLGLATTCFPDEPEAATTPLSASRPSSRPTSR